MSIADPDSLPPAIQIRDTCLCLQMQRAARRIARHFDHAFRELGITSGQFSLLNAVSGPIPTRIADVAATLSVDRTTLTAALKPLLRHDLVAVLPDAQDQRIRRISITRTGRDLLRRATRIWIKQHQEIESQMPGEAQGLRSGLKDFQGVLDRISQA